MILRLGAMAEGVRAKRGPKLPVVLTVAEVAAHAHPLRTEGDAVGVEFEKCRVALDQTVGGLENARAQAIDVVDLSAVVAGGLEHPELVTELRRAGLDVVAVPAGAPLSPPLLHRVEGDWVLDRGTGVVVRGSLRDVRRALGLP